VFEAKKSKELPKIQYSSDARKIQKEVSAPVKKLFDTKPFLKVTYNEIQSSRLGLDSKFSKTDMVQRHKVGDGSMCSLCINAAVQEINVLLNYILNGIIVNDCEDLCSYLGNGPASAACTLVCLGFGLDEFIYLITTAQIDPIWYCQILDMCAIDDCQGDCLDITKYTTQPPKAPLGTTLTQYLTVNVKKPWNGTGMLSFTIFPISNPNLEVESDDSLLEGGFGPVGITTYAIQLETTEGFQAGNYITEIQICNGMCGSTNPHSRVFSQMNSSFTLTSSKVVYQM